MSFLVVLRSVDVLSVQLVNKNSDWLGKLKLQKLCFYSSMHPLFLFIFAPTPSSFPTLFIFQSGIQPFLSSSHRLLPCFFLPFPLQTIGIGTRACCSFPSIFDNSRDLWMKEEDDRFMFISLFWASRNVRNACICPHLTHFPFL